MDKNKKNINIDNAVIELAQIEGLDYRKNELMSRHTTLRIGGPADLLLYPRSQDELIRVIRILNNHQVPWQVLGRGSNLLVLDKGIRGAVIKLDEGFSNLNVDGTLVEVGGGHSTILLSALMSKRGLKGLEFAGGIPGNIGGAVYMNAGAHGSDISRVLLSADVLLKKSGEIVSLSNKDLQFSYRTSVLQKDIEGIVLKARFGLSIDSKEKISTMFTKYKNHRKATQPLQFPCAGSVFRNPPSDYAGRLLEEANLKGYTVGDAQISTLHGNFIINCGSATAQDVLSLIDSVQKVIRQKYNIHLMPEVLVVGEA